MAKVLTDSRLLALLKPDEPKATTLFQSERTQIVASHRALAAERDQCKKVIDLWFGPNSCSVCGGQPLASGRECVCGGKGTMQSEFEGLRQTLFESNMEHEAMRLTITEFEREVDAAWLAIHRGWEIEPRAYFEEQAPRNGFESPLAMAVHYMWKRKAKDNEAVESFRERAVRAIREKFGRECRSVDVCSLVESLPLEPEQEERL